MREASTTGTPETSNRGARRRVRLLAFAMVGFLTWAALILWNQQGRLGVKAAQVEELEQKRIETIQSNENYKKEIERLNDPEYILQKIRKEYHYSRPGETLFYTPKSP
ncbi:FtsB family cell division protein [Paenibacillus flagellatus]|uniref:Cell division protein n=1 Tax=Paenibacillus flagellatus TaxID=2211139 RepID=A0A2V5JUY3_9BACL|nr:septum formation initiator family protein [Paenibacillus flagellatus]PYI50231.1 cell division protein [Paenibacillus flagellatus]